MPVMKILVAILSGFMLTLAIFGGGALTAVYLIGSEPGPARPLDMQTSALWTNKAVRVSSASESLQRLPARPTPQQPDQAPAPGSQSIDTATTAAIKTPPTGPAMNASHVEWCSRHYRSYDPRDNSYNAYSGNRRECVSPYPDDRPSADAPDIINASSNESGLVGIAQADEVNASDSRDARHMQSCFDRYRSYRPQDNTYQPYGGGPRQSCE